MKALIGKIGGRKFLLAIIGAVLIALSSVIGIELSPEKITAVSGIVASFILAQGYADGKSQGATSTTTENTKEI